MNFVREQLQSDWLPFTLSEPGGRTLTEEESSFDELGLVSFVCKRFACFIVRERETLHSMYFSRAFFYINLAYNLRFLDLKIARPLLTNSLLAGNCLTCLILDRTGYEATLYVGEIPLEIAS